MKSLRILGHCTTDIIQIFLCNVMHFIHKHRINVNRTVKIFSI